MANAPQQQAPKTTVYAIAVKTSDVRNAGTDANVYVQLTGELGIGPRLQLKTSINHRNKFERNRSDVFVFPDQEALGALKQLKIWHDNSGVGPGWHLNIVEVNDGLSGINYTFPCNPWLDKTEGGKQICRVLDCSRTKQKVAKQLRIAAESQPVGQPSDQGSVDQGSSSQVQPVQAPQFGSPVPQKSNVKEELVVVPKEAPVFGMFPYGYGYGYGGYPYYGYGMGYRYPYYGYGHGCPYYGGGYGYFYPYYGGGYDYGLGFGTGLMMGGFMGRSWSWSFF